jgi:hypothetical protein
MLAATSRWNWTYGVSQDAAHDPRAQSQVVLAVGQAGDLLIGDAQPDLVDQGGGLQGRRASLTLELVTGDGA